MDIDTEHVKTLRFVQSIIKNMDNPPPHFSYNTTWESVVFPEGYEKPPKEEFEAKLQELLNEELWEELREERNKRITETDYLATIDYPHPTEEAKQAWLAYRQALRDLPANTTDPENPVWPEAPTP